MGTSEETLDRLRSLANDENRAGMARFGITGANVLGISVTTLCGVARDVLRPMKRDAAARHELAGRLWESGNPTRRASWRLWWTTRRW